MNDLPQDAKKAVVIGAGFGGLAAAVRLQAAGLQVTADLMGNYSLDSPIDADDVTANDAELTISSLGSGSGSLCTETCFGFTFPPQSGL